MTTTGKWTKSDLRGVYVYADDPRLSVQTYCECRVDGCHARWAVYWDGGMFGSVEGSLRQYLTEVKALAIDLLPTLAADTDN